jgi:hypothetical protein
MRVTEKDSVGKLFDIFLESPKQSFVAIDEVGTQFGLAMTASFV